MAVGSDSAALNLNDPGEGPHCPIARPSLETIRRPRAYILLPILQRGNFFYDLRHTGGLRLVPPCLPYVLPGFGHGLGASAAVGRQQCGQRNAFGNDGASRSAAFPQLQRGSGHRRLHGANTGQRESSQRRLFRGRLLAYPVGLPLRSRDRAAAAEPSLVGGHAQPGGTHHPLQAAADLSLLVPIFSGDVCSWRTVGDL